MRRPRASPPRLRSAAAAREDGTGPTVNAACSGNKEPVLNRERSGYPDEEHSSAAPADAAPLPHLSELWKGRHREPCYLAARLWGVNALDVKSMKAVVVFRIYMIFRPRGEALRLLPPGNNRISSGDAGWTEELVESLPTLNVYNGKETDANEKKE